MIPVGQAQHLGPKAFILLLIRRGGIGVALFILALLLFSFSGLILSGLTNTLQLAGSASQANVAGAVSLLANAIVALFLISIIVFMVGFIVALLQYRNYTFTFDEFDLSMVQGVLYKKEIALPYRQIQDVDIDRSFFHILLGLSRVVMQTAAHEEVSEQGLAEVVLEPLDAGVAEDVRVMLERKIGVQVVKDETVADAQQAAAPHIADTL